MSEVSFHVRSCSVEINKMVSEKHCRLNWPRGKKLGTSLNVPWVTEKSWNGVAWLADGTGNGITWRAEWVWNGVAWLADEVWNGVAWLADGVWNGITWLADGVLYGVTRLADGVLIGVAWLAEWIWNGLLLWIFRQYVRKPSSSPFLFSTVINFSNRNWF